MEDNQVKFLSHNYRVLLDERWKRLNELDALFRSQNKEVLERLLKDGIIDEKGLPVGLVKTPTSKEEAELSYKIALEASNKFKEYGGKEEILIDINELITKLSITNTDITKCLIP